MNGMYVGEYAGKSTVECCLMLILLASSLVTFFLEETTKTQNLLNIFPGERWQWRFKCA